MVRVGPINRALEDLDMQLSLPLWRAPRTPATPRAGALARSTAPGGWLSRDEAIMGTAVRVDLWAASRSAGEAAIDAVMAEMHRIDRSYSPHRSDSELSRINRDAHRAPVEVSDETFRLLTRAIECSERSGGAFDITYASVGQLYDYRRGVHPDDKALARARECVGWRHLVLDAEARTVSFAREGVRIDLGGFAKGHAVDLATAILRRHGIASAMVAAGGDSRVLGDRRGRPWTIAIRHPRRPNEVIAVLPLEDVAISTSGDYERFFDKGGRRYHHLIDPGTGRSPDHVHSVTVLAADGLTSEGLSKSVFVLGVERGLALIEAHPGTDAVIVDAQGALHFSSGLQRH
jgi:thiamine biosynthesis lipoprotein